MLYYKIPLNTNLSQTSYRDRRDTETNIFIEYNEGFVGEEWVAIEESELIAEFGCNPFLVTEETAELPEVSEQDEINARTVSYTHLDVYKRQALPVVQKLSYRI